MFKDKYEINLAVGDIVFYDNYPYKHKGKVFDIDPSSDFPVRILCGGKMNYLRKHHLQYLEVLRKEDSYEQV